jgi:hypothetical protein
MCTDNGIKKGQRKAPCLTGMPAKKKDEPAGKNLPGIPDLLREIKNMPGGKSGRARNKRLFNGGARFKQIY